MKTKNKFAIIKLILFVILLATQVISTEEIKFEKTIPIYDLGEEIKLSINNLQPNTSVLIETKYEHSTIWQTQKNTTVNGEIKFTLNKSGKYDVKATKYTYNNETNTTTSQIIFSEALTINTFNIQIDVEKTIIPKNNNLKLTANAINNQGTTTYTWLLNDGTGEIKTGKEINHNFPNTGTHKVKLIAKDIEENENTAEISITVQDARIIWVEVRSEATNELIEDAKVDFGIANAKTDNLGRALFYLPTRTYILEVSKNQHRNTRQYVDVTKDSTYVIYLGRDRKEYNKPVIIADTLLGNTITTETTKLNFEVYDESPTMCEVYIKRKDSAWKYVERYEILGDMKVYTTEFKNLKPTRYDWRIDCEDTYGNRAIQESHFFVNYEYEQEEQEIKEPTQTLDKNHTEVTKPILDNIEKIKQEINKYSDRQKKASNLFNQVSEINKIEKDIRTLESELYRLTRESTLEIFEKRQEEIKKEIEEKTSQIITYIDIIETKNIEKENSKDLYNQHHKNSGKIISDTIIKTEILQIRTDTLSGESTYYILITHKGLETTETLTVSFPTNFVNERSKIYTTNHMKLIKDDLVIEFTPNNNKEIVYYVQSANSLDNLNNLEYVNIKPQTNKETKITGNTITKTTEMVKNNFLFMLIGLLFITFIFYNYEVGDKIKTISKETIQKINNNKMSEDARNIIQDIKNAKKIIHQDMQEAKKTYSKVMISYEGLTGKEKEQVYHDAISLHSAIIEKKMDDIITLIDTSLEREDKKSAEMHLDKLEKIYKGLDTKLKEKLKYKVVLANMNLKNNNN